MPYHKLEIAITVTVGASANGFNEVSVSGGEAPSKTVKRPVVVSTEPTPFGVEDYELTPENEGGSLDTQAGSHPFQLTTTLALNQAAESLQGNSVYPALPALARDLHFNLPPGLVGDVNAIPQCSEADFFTEGKCPSDTVMGIASVTFVEPKAGFGLGIETASAPVFNLKPAPGEPASFGFVAGAYVLLNTSVRTGGNYGVVVSAERLPQSVTFLANRVTFWGVPGDPRHNRLRGTACLDGSPSCTAPKEEHPAPFLTLPTSCTGPLQTTVEADSWAQAGDFRSFPANEPGESLNGCDELSFAPSISAAPDGEAASTPTGLTVGVHVPQATILAATGLAESTVKSTTVALPEGVQVSPSGANGLEACSNTQIGFTGFNSQTGTDEFTDAAPSCPDASKIATVKITTPLLPNPLEGEVYLGAPQNFTGPLENPFGSLVALYLVAEDPTAGVLVKLAGKVTLNPTTGQLVTTFESPQVPFEEAEFHFFGGERAPLSTPSHCGPYTTQASITPWSGNAAVEPSSSFDITSGPNGAPCSDPLPFAPSLVSDTTNINAGSFSPLTTTLSREDGQQSIQSVQLHYPPGLSGLLSSVKLCGEAEANAGTCGPESEIGETIVSVGLGSDPFTVTGGKVYITGPYEGAPFGLSIVNPAKAGPFDLLEGRPVVVRAKIEVNPTTAALTITTDPPGSPYAIPTIIEGIPLQIKHVNVTINRPGFTINPTDCDSSAITGAIDSAEGASSPVSVPFQVTNCASLKFEPKFSVSTSGKTSKAYGASLTAKVSEPNVPQGTDADIAKVKVDLPKQLPSRLTTLEKACTNAQFELNPANCPAASKIGYAVVHTPLLPVPLEGPAIFVSHGGEAFPSLTMVLQGENVRIDLVGTTFISKAGITSTTFKAVPDQPFSTFELVLPEGKYSALAANGDLCTSKLAMPTAFVGQNGAEIHESTAIDVTGCAKAKALTRAQKLAKALKACKQKAKGKRAKCEKQARKRYGKVKRKKARK